MLPARPRPSIRALSFEDLDGASGGDTIATLEMRQPALHEFITSNVESEEAGTCWPSSRWPWIRRSSLRGARAEAPSRGASSHSRRSAIRGAGLVRIARVLAREPMSLNLATLLRESAKRYPTKPAIHVNDVVLPYQLVDGMAQRFAGALRALGVTAGQHVAVMLPNVPRVHHRVLRLPPGEPGGAAQRPAHRRRDRLPPERLRRRRAGRLGGFYEAARAGFDRVASCKHILVAKADRADMTAPEGALNFTATAMAAQPIGGVPATSPDDTAVILYTSGTTGRPKGAELSHINLLYNADVMSQLPSRVPADQQVVLVVLPLFHSFGQTVMQNCAIRGGGTMVLMPRFSRWAPCS